MLTQPSMQVFRFLHHESSTSHDLLPLIQLSQPWPSVFGATAPAILSAKASSGPAVTPVRAATSLSPVLLSSSTSLDRYSTFPAGTGLPFESTPTPTIPLGCAGTASFPGFTSTGICPSTISFSVPVPWSRLAILASRADLSPSVSSPISPLAACAPTNPFTLPHNPSLFFLSASLILANSISCPALSCSNKCNCSAFASPLKNARLASSSLSNSLCTNARFWRREYATSENVPYAATTLEMPAKRISP